MTLGQNTGYFCAPNPVYDTALGYTNRPGSDTPEDTWRHTTDRDLPMEIVEELAVRGANVRVLLYCPSHPGAVDWPALKKWGWLPEQGSYGTPKPTGPASTEAWFKVVGWWSRHYGEKISGWWMDGMYDEAWYDLEKYACYLKSGNANSIVAFNRGINMHTASSADDYLAGEQNDDICRLHDTLWTDGFHNHMVTYLGTTWGEGDVPQYTAEKIADTLRIFQALGACVTYDIPIAKNGHIPQSFLNVLHEAGKRIKQ